MTPRRKICANRFRYVWRKSAVGKLPKSHLVLVTKKTPAPRDSSEPPFCPNWAARSQKFLNVVACVSYLVWIGEGLPELFLNV